MNIIQWLLENNHAKAQRHAENIIVLLKLNELYDLKDYEGIKARVLLYEAWKTSGLYDKKDRAACAMKAIAGEPVPAPVVDMFAPSPIRQIIKKGVAACQEHGFSFIQLYKLTDEEKVKDGWDLYVISPVHLSDTDYYYCGVIRADGTTDIRQ